jgi:hypothetical protein
MDNIMKYLQLILLGMAMLVVPVMPSLVLCGLSLVYFKKHDWERGFFNDKWGMLGVASFLASIMIFVVGVYLPTRQ